MKENGIHRASWNHHLRFSTGFCPVKTAGPQRETCKEQPHKMAWSWQLRCHIPAQWSLVSGAAQTVGSPHSETQLRMTMCNLLSEHLSQIIATGKQHVAVQDSSPAALCVESFPSLWYGSVTFRCWRFSISAGCLVSFTLTFPLLFMPTSGMKNGDFQGTGPKVPWQACPKATWKPRTKMIES